MSHGNAPALTMQQAAAVRAKVRLRRTLTNKAIARDMKISHHTVAKYARGIRWGG